MSDKPYNEAMKNNVLILCSHNSARSVLAECMLNHIAAKLGKGVRAFSAGSTPSGRINPFAIDALKAAGVDTAGLRSKSWDEFAKADAPRMRIVITVCDSAAAETCPYWPGSPVQVHWGYADPSNAAEAERAAAFEKTRQAIADRMTALLELPIETMTDGQLQRSLRELARD